MQVTGLSLSFLSVGSLVIQPWTKPKARKPETRVGRAWAGYRMPGRAENGLFYATSRRAGYLAVEPQ